MTRTRIKICGLTRPEDAAAASAAGADAVGVILAPSKRRVSLERAAEILRDVPGSVVTVGVFVNPSLEEVLEAVERLRLDSVQLHGSESRGFCLSLPPTLGRVKAFRVGPDFDVEALLEYRGAVQGVLLDTFVPGEEGGTGAVFDWRVIAGRMPAWAVPLLAGGLTSENVGEAIRTVAPFGVDVSSGVESAPGVKDHDRIRSFVAAVRAADRGVPNV